MKLEAFNKFKVTKKNQYERLPLDDGIYLVLAIGNYHGMSVTDRDLFNTQPTDEPTAVLLVRCNGALISTRTSSASLSEIESLIAEGYVKEVE